MDDILEEYREKIIYALAALGAFLLWPFALNNVVQGRWLLGAGTLSICAILVYNAVALKRGGLRPIPLLYLYPPVMGSLAVAIPTMGMPAILWSYPAMILFYFVLNRTEATVTNLVLVLTVGSLAGQHLGSTLTVRIVVTQLLICLFCHIFLSIIANLQGKLHAQTVVDPLTGAFNRREMDRALTLTLERARRFHTSATLLSIDIDHFKKINDQLGHDAGDHTLKAVVSLIQRRLRKVDQLFRAGGEEFIVLLGDTCSRGALRVAQSLCQQVAEAELLPDRKVTISLGVAELQAEDDVASWLKRGDRCLYQAKHHGRNRVISAPAEKLPSLN